MTPDQGRKRTSGKGKRPSPGSIEARRLGLVAFGAGFLVLFLIVAISEGIGSPSVSDGDVAVVEKVPSEIGNVSQERFDRAMRQTAAAAGQNKVPKPGEAQYDELKDQALNSLFEIIWLQGLGEEMDVEVTDEKVAEELKKVKEENFPKPAEYRKFLKEAKYTRADVLERVRLQVISGEIQKQLQEEAPQPSSNEIEAYYEAAKSTQFTQPATRSIRLVVNKARKKADAAKTALEKENTAKAWNRVAKRFSEDDATKDNGGLQENVTEGTLEPALDEAVFSATEGEVSGPVKTEKGWNVFEVQNASNEKVQSLDEVESQIKSTLAQRLEQETFASFVSNFNTLWTSRTFCAEGFVTERCANFKSDGRPATADPACYEANPDGGRPEDCPAPVFQLVPAMPGSITPLEPRGTPMAQRPVPAGGVQPEEAGGLPPGLSLPPPGG